MQGLLFFITTLSSAAALAPNLQPNLLPPHAGGWRGSTLGSLNGDPAQFTRKYGAPLHIARVFSPNLTTVDLAFIHGGGIVWVDISVSNWTEAATSAAFAPKISEVADVFASVAPAQMFLCVDHEPDHNVDTAWNTVPMYRAMWVVWQRAFAARNVTNAVWVMDFSTQLAGKNAKERVATAKALWPAPEARVDWLFFNTFQTNTWPSFSTIAGTIYASLLSLNVSGIETVPMGLGAFGSHNSLDDATRADFLNYAAKALNTNTLPRVRAAIYFDSLESAVSGKMMLASYEAYLNTPYFSFNDKAEGAVV